MTPRTVLLTGGAGYIGSHACLALLERGDRVVVVDSLRNSTASVIDRVRSLVPGEVVLHEVDVRDYDALGSVFAAHAIDAVIHFAGLKSVSESIRMPQEYYGVNLGGTIALVRAMERHGVRRLVFSSSCAVYGPGEGRAVREDAAIGGTTPYARSKRMAEALLRDLTVDPSWGVMALRYFNPVGAHPSGHLGEHPTGTPNNLMPFLMQVAGGQRSELVIFGDDYDTRDGTCVRDYVHVVDVAAGHLAALDALAETSGFRAVNLGTGRGHTVIELLAAASDVIGRPIPHRFGPRRPGDATALWADASLAEAVLGWRAMRTLRDMCSDAWRFQQQHPTGQ